jgi:transposase
MAAITQIRHKHSQGRAYYERKITEGNTHKEALRCLKRRISDALYVALAADARHAAAACPQGPGGQPGNLSVSRAAGSHPARRLFGQPLRGPPPPYGPAPLRVAPRLNRTERFAAGLPTPSRCTRRLCPP